MSDELRQMAGKAVDHALAANERTHRDTNTADRALVSIALSLAYIVAEDIRSDDIAAADKSRLAGLCYDHMDEAETKGPCRVAGCEQKARR